MHKTVRNFAAVVVVLELTKAVKSIRNLKMMKGIRNPEEPFSVFDPAKMPAKVDIQIEGDTTATKVLYHLFGAAWWALKRDIANEKLRHHTEYFHHETEVTQFKRELDED